MRTRMRKCADESYAMHFLIKIKTSHKLSVSPIIYFKLMPLKR